jgi:hypothetical protein
MPAVLFVNARVGRRAPFLKLGAALLAVVVAMLLLPPMASAAEWTGLERVSPAASSRLDSLHQLAAARGVLHLVHPRVGPGKRDDRVLYQRSGNDGRTWSAERVLFRATPVRRTVVPNLAVAARGHLVVVAFRVSGPREHVLFVRVSRDGGLTFGKAQAVFGTRKSDGIGVPAVAIGDRVIAVAWTNRADGAIKLRTSRDQGLTFKEARTVGTTRHSIACKGSLTDGLVGLAASGKSIHLAWSNAPRRQCYADDLRVRTSLDRGGSWSPVRTITERDSYGWPELEARGKTVVATAQATSGGLIVSRSGHNGRKWRDRLIKAPKRHNLGAADVVLLPRQRAVLVYVNETLGKKGKLISTRVISRLSTDGGGSWTRPRPVSRGAQRLRMAPNLAANDGRVVLVVQSGQLDGAPRHVYAARLR